MLYRYEVALSGGFQLGLFQAPFDNKQLTEEEYTEYFELNKRLRRPELKGNPTFYFSKKGYELLYRLVEIMLKAIPKHLEPELIEIKLERAKGGLVVYRDRYQVALDEGKSRANTITGIPIDLDYWHEAMKNRMPERDEINRLASVLKGYLYEHNLYLKKFGKREETPLDFWDDKRPYGNKNIGQSIAFNLGWDYKRKLTQEEMPDWVYREAERLHRLVKLELQDEEKLFGAKASVATS